MRLPATAAVLATTASLLLAPFAGSAGADHVTTTSTIMAYTADLNANGTAELYTAPANGHGPATRVFTNTHDVWLPSLSPDGTKLAYLYADLPVGDYRAYRLYVKALDGSAGPGTLVLPNLDVVSSASWSADGTKLVATGFAPGGSSYGTYVVKATGADPMLVPTTSSAYGEEPSFSPSGDIVAVSAVNSGWDYVGIDLISLTTGRRARVAGTAGGSDPQWSPDGQHIVFQRLLPPTTCGLGLYRVPASGGTAVTLRETEQGFIGSAEFARDGSQLFWHQAPMRACGTTAPKGELWVGNADASNPVNVTNTPTIYESGTTVAGAPAIAPDTTPPTAPAIAAKGVVNGTTVTIGWTPTSDDTVEYVVVRKPGGTPAPVAPIDGTFVYRGPARTAMAVGLITGDVYDFYVFAIDANGLVSPASAAHPAKPTRIPVVSPIGRVGTTTTGTAFTVRWTGTAAAYQVWAGEKKKSATGSWPANPTMTKLVDSTNELSVAYTTGVQGRSYYFEVRGHDGLGNVTHPSSRARADVPLNENYTAFRYGSGWVAKTSSTRYLGTYRTTTTPGASVSMRADTSRFVVIGDKCSTCGAFKVYVDGVLKATVDTKSATSKVRQVLYAGGVFSSIKARTIRIVAVGTSGRPRVSIDAIGLQR